MYSAGKHAVIRLTKSAALEVAGRGTRVTAVCPEAIDGAMDELFMTYFGLTWKDEPGSRKVWVDGGCSTR